MTKTLFQFYMRVCRTFSPLLTVMSCVRHGWMMLQMPILVLWHSGSEAAVPVPVRGRICKYKAKTVVLPSVSYHYICTLKATCYG